MSDTFIDIAALSKTYSDDTSFLRKMMGATRSVQAVNNVSLRLKRGETVGLVGESGCGKSTLARCIAGLEPISEGNIKFDGQHVDMRVGSNINWYRRRAQIVFQDPQSSLNRSQTIEAILARPLLVQKRVTRRDLRARIEELLLLVGLNSSFLYRYPHELSGGQRQRVGIARALAVEPEFIVLDEPVSALDVSIAAQIVNLLLELQARLNLTYLFISHDLNIVRYLSDWIAVMYLGKIVEFGPAEEIYANPRHPYTQLLLKAVPVPDPALRGESVVVRGEVPSPMNPPTGCAFHPRCPLADARCRSEAPKLSVRTASVQVRCHLYDQRDDPVSAVEMSPSKSP